MPQVGLDGHQLALVEVVLIGKVITPKRGPGFVGPASRLRRLDPDVRRRGHSATHMTQEQCHLLFEGSLFCGRHIDDRFDELVKFGVQLVGIGHHEKLSQRSPVLLPQLQGRQCLRACGRFPAEQIGVVNAIEGDQVTLLILVAVSKSFDLAGPMLHECRRQLAGAQRFEVRPVQMVGRVEVGQGGRAKGGCLAAFRPLPFRRGFVQRLGPRDRASEGDRLSLFRRYSVAVEERARRLLVVDTDQVQATCVIQFESERQLFVANAAPAFPKELTRACRGPGFRGRRKWAVRP
jgi:hypothetical protein